MGTIDSLIARNRDLLLNRDHEANKGTYGKLLVIAGSRGMAGAACLASRAAFRAGIGMVKVFGPECNRLILQISLPEAMYTASDFEGADIPSAYVGSGQSAEHSCIDKEALAAGIDWADYIIAGPGLSRNPQAKELIRVLYSEECRKLLRDKKMLILDADALNLIAESGLEPGILCPNTVITPHVGEMSRLCSLTIGEIKQDPEKAAADYCSRHGVTVVLKDAVTVVAEPGTEQEGTGTDARGGQGAVRVLRIDSGCGAMAKAGSGDVLCGFLAGTAAVLKGNIRDAVPIGVWLHGRAGSIAAGEKGCHSILAGDIADAAGEAIRHC